MPSLRSITFREIEHRLVDGDALLVGMCGKIPHIGGMEQGLGGNAAHKQAGATESVVFLDNGRFQAILSGADGCRVAARAASNHYKVVCHAPSFYMACQLRRSFSLH